MLNIPNQFCWTRMGSESGESLDNILARKELERKLGDGTFMWGIGNALGSRIWNLIDNNSGPKVLFSKMKSKPKKIDVSPDTILLWRSYIDRHGEYKTLPQNVFLTSRGGEKNIKKKHYALVCNRQNEITSKNGIYIDFASLKNLNSDKKTIGYSQVTAVVEKKKESSTISKLYPLIFDANLVSPYYITLTDPIAIPVELIEELKDLIQNNPDIDEYERFILDIKNEYSISKKPVYYSLFK